MFMIILKDFMICDFGSLEELLVVVKSKPSLRVNSFNRSRIASEDISLVL